MSAWTIELPGVLPASMNVRERQSHWVRKKELDGLIVIIGALGKAMEIPPATGRRSVTITIHKTQRSRTLDDPANLPSRAKSVLDAMTRTGLLKDDNVEWLEWGGVVEGPKMERVMTVIELAECPTSTTG